MSPTWSDRAAGEQVGGLLGVEARHLEGVLEVLTEGAGRSITSTETTSHDPIMANGRRAANLPQRYSACDSMVVSPSVVGGAWSGEEPRPSVTSPGGGHIGR